MVPPGHASVSYFLKGGGCRPGPRLSGDLEGENAMRYFPSVRPSRWAMVCCAMAVLGLAAPVKAEGPQDYEKTVEVSGTVISIGSDTLANLMNFWSEGFKKLHPNVTFQIEAKGSATAPPALTE